MSHSRDYVTIAVNYAKEAVADKKRDKFGELIRLAAKRFLLDLKRAEKEKCSFYFDDWHANDVCDFIEKLPHVEGKWDSTFIELHSSHIFFLVQLFGFRDREPIYVDDWSEDDLFYPRRFTSALFAVARKNAKSTLAACILLYCFCCEPEEGSQVISAATTFSQASIIFNIAKMMIDKTPDLKSHFGLKCWSKAITRLTTNSNFKPLHAKASTQDGLNPNITSFDEIHAHKTPDLLNVLESAEGARANPLKLYTTTEGYINAGPWGEIKNFIRKILYGVLCKESTDHFLALFYCIDDENEEHKIKSDDPFDETKWIKANPLIDVNDKLLEAIRKAATEAKQMPSKLAEFLIKRVNRSSAGTGSWVNYSKWKLCGGKVDLEYLKNYPCYGALDLSSTTDFTSFRLVWFVDGMIYTKGWRWVPEDAVKQRTERGTSPYSSWVSSGLLKTTPGDVVDYNIIETDVLAICEQFKVQLVAYDRWNATQLVNNLITKGLPMIEFIQGTKSYHPAMQTVETYYLKKKLVHGNDEVLNWCASNLISIQDTNLNNKPDKKRSADKIDDMVTLFMAAGIANIEAIEDEEDYMNNIRNPIIV